MQNHAKYAKMLALILSSLATVVVPISSMYVLGDIMKGVFPEHVRNAVVLMVGIFGFGVGVALFWFVAKLLREQEEEET